MLGLLRNWQRAKCLCIRENVVALIQKASPSLNFCRDKFQKTTRTCKKRDQFELPTHVPRMEKAKNSVFEEVCGLYHLTVTQEMLSCDCFFWNFTLLHFLCFCRLTNNQFVLSGNFAEPERKMVLLDCSSRTRCIPIGGLRSTLVIFSDILSLQRRIIVPLECFCQRDSLYPKSTWLFFSDRRPKRWAASYDKKRRASSSFCWTLTSASFLRHQWDHFNFWVEKLVETSYGQLIVLHFMLMRTNLSHYCLPFIRTFRYRFRQQK